MAQHINVATSSSLQVFGSTNAGGAKDVTESPSSILELPKSKATCYVELGLLGPVSQSCTMISARTVPETTINHKWRPDRTDDTCHRGEREREHWFLCGVGSEL